MACYLIGIGGTGAKCIEAITHLSAAGLLPEQEVYTFFVDPDQSNGNLERAKLTLDRYVEGQKISLGSSSLFQTNIRLADPHVWAPFKDHKSDLKKILSYNQLRIQNEELAALIDVLYSEEEKTTDLKKGFRGRPSIGSAVIADQLSFDEEPWKTLREQVEDDIGGDETARVFLCGSVFGGTGAAGLPTLGKLIREKIESSENVEIACGLTLPYFTFEGKPPEDQGLHARSKSFVPNTKSALKYYWEKRHAEIFDGLYVVGDPAMNSVGEASVGGPSQENRPHFVELLVGLGGVDFFHQGCDAEPVALMARESSDELTWDDLPYPQNSLFKRRLSQLVHFSFAYLSTYKPALNEIYNSSRYPYEFPWYVDLIERYGIDLDDEWHHVETIETYVQHFLTWIAEMHETAHRTDASLFDYRAFADQKPDGHGVSLKDERDFRRGRFGVLHRPNQEGETTQLPQTWERLSSKTSSNQNTEGIGVFLRALHDVCDPDNFSKG